MDYSSSFEKKSLAVIEVISSKFVFEKNCFVKSTIELAVKIRKNTCNFTSGLKPASLVKDEFCKNFHDSFRYSHFCGIPFGDFLSEKILLLGNFEEWSARKYIAFINDFKACVYHYGYDTCQAKGSRKDLAESGKSYNNKSNNKTKIQSNAILADLRDKKKWEDVNKTVKSVTNVRKISNEKIKMVKKLQPSSKMFSGVKALQPYLAEKDRILMHKINENSQYVFKTSLEKMKFAKSMHRNNNTYMSSEYCFLTVIIKV